MLCSFLRLSRLCHLTISCNCVPMQNLFLAELVAMRKPVPNCTVIKAAYDKAIRNARRSGFRMIVGIAAERAGNFFASLLPGNHDTKNWAGEYLELSVSEFYEWGAHTKVAQMQECYDSILVDFVNQLQAKGDHQLSVTTSAKMRGVTITALKGPKLSDISSHLSSNLSAISNNHSSQKQIYE